MARKNISEKEKKDRRQKQQREWVRKKRAKLTDAMLEERRTKDRERYKKKKESGLVKGINDLTPRAQKQIRKQWRERTQKHRELKKKAKEAEYRLLNETPPLSPIPQSSNSLRQIRGRQEIDKNRRKLKIENRYLKNRILLLENRLARNRMKLVRKNRNNKTVSVEVPEEIIISRKKKSLLDLKKAVHEFLERDDVSRLTAGKKETITRNKIKKQIRLLSDTLLNLYKKFKEDTGIKISYALFCRNRPFWVLIPDVKKRNTCLCATHANMEYIIASLKKARIVNASTSNELIKSVCCGGHFQVNCLMKKCDLCKDKSVNLNAFEGTDTVSCERWLTKKTPIQIGSTTKLCQRTVKETFVTTKSSLAKTFNEKLPAYMRHLANIINQYKTVTKIKKTLLKDEAFLHIDFAENYLCKYGEEVQSAHFGASKPQISLHTAVLYMHGQNNDSIQCLCSISQNLRHDPILICAHLRPVLSYIKEKVPHIKSIHFQSDGPTTQYKNKSMFFLLAKYIALELGVDNIVWHYSESGHGKGAPDGIGACVKRTADAQVALGRDVSNYEELISCLQDNCKGIQIFRVDETHIDHISNILEKSTTLPFKGTQTIRQLTWSKSNPDVIHARSLSCLTCHPGQICSHHEIGIIFLTRKAETISTSPQESVSARVQKLVLPDQSNKISPTSTRKKINFFEFCYGSDEESDDSINLRRLKSKRHQMQRLSSSSEDEIF